MVNLTLKVKNAYQWVRDFFPSPLPQGMAEFDKWALSLQATHELPTASLNDVRYVLATLIINSGALTASKPKYYFVKALRAGAAKQVAGAVFQDIQIKQKAAVEAAKLAEATAKQPVASHVEIPY